VNPEAAMRPREHPLHIVLGEQIAGLQEPEYLSSAWFPGTSQMVPIWFP